MCGRQYEAEGGGARGEGGGEWLGRVVQGEGAEVLV